MHTIKRHKQKYVHKIKTTHNGKNTDASFSFGKVSGAVADAPNLFTPALSAKCVMDSKLKEI